MNNKKNIYEKPIIYIVIIMICVGLVLLYNASSTLAINKFNNYSFFINKHLIRLLIGIIAFIFAYNFKYSFLKNNAKVILLISWIVMISAYFFNEGSVTRRWLIVYGQNIFTTSDLAKLSLIIYPLLGTIASINSIFTTERYSWLKWIVYLDEFAFVDNTLQEEFFASVYPTISSGNTSRVMITSTPKGMNLFYKFNQFFKFIWFYTILCVIVF